MNIINKLILDAVANSSTVNSAAVLSQFFTSISATAKFSDAAAAGSFKLQASNDASTPVTWNDIPNTAQTVVAGAAVMIPATVLCYQWIRIVFVSSGGAGTITARFKALEAS